MPASLRCANNTVVATFGWPGTKPNALLWKDGKLFGAIGRLSPNYYTHDGVIPRTRLPEALHRIQQIAQKYRLRIANVFHAGDGNLHPLVLYNEKDADEIQRVLQAGEDILRTCVDLGGVLSGEHGIGLEKNCMSWLFNDDDLDVMLSVRQVFNPHELCNPQDLSAARPLSLRSGHHRGRSCCHPGSCRRRPEGHMCTPERIQRVARQWHTDHCASARVRHVPGALMDTSLMHADFATALQSLGPYEYCYTGDAQARTLSMAFSLP